MQATISAADDSGGRLLLDDGRELPFRAVALAASGLRHVRVGQRVTLSLDDAGSVDHLWIVGIGAGRPIR